MERTWTCESPEGMAEIARQIMEICPNARIFAIFGDLGSGKTTLVREWARVLGSENNVTSPTFSLVNVYSRPGGEIYHFDLYRLREFSELAGIGFGEYLASEEYVFVEWPELAMPYFSGEAVILSLSHSGEQKREVKLNA